MTNSHFNLTQVHNDCLTGEQQGVGQALCASSLRKRAGTISENVADPAMDRPEHSPDRRWQPVVTWARNFDK